MEAVTSRQSPLWFVSGVPTRIILFFQSQTVKTIKPKPEHFRTWSSLFPVLQNVRQRLLILRRKVTGNWPLTGLVKLDQNKGLLEHDHEWERTRLLHFRLVLHDVKIDQRFVFSYCTKNTFPWDLGLLGCRHWPAEEGQKWTVWMDTFVQTVNQHWLPKWLWMKQSKIVLENRVVHNERGYNHVHSSARGNVSVCIISRS